MTGSEIPQVRCHYGKHHLLAPILALVCSAMGYG
jgi:hypothetical protein